MSLIQEILQSGGPLIAVQAPCCQKCDRADCPTLGLPEPSPCSDDAEEVGCRGTDSYWWDYEDPVYCRACAAHNDKVFEAKLWCSQHEVDWRARCLAAEDDTNRMSLDIERMSDEREALRDEVAALRDLVAILRNRLPAAFLEGFYAADGWPSHYDEEWAASETRTWAALGTPDAPEQQCT